MASYAKYSKIAPEFDQLLKTLPVAGFTEDSTVEDYRKVVDALGAFQDALYTGPKDCDVTGTAIEISNGVSIPVKVYAPNETARAAAGNRPPSILFHVHGGGWVSGGPEFGHAHCLWFSSHNVVVVNVDYRLCPENPYDTPYNDSYGVYRAIHQAAINREYHELENWGIPEFDAEKVYFYGTSAGGQIVTACAILDIENNRAGVIKGLFLHATTAVDVHLFPTEKISSDEEPSMVQNKDGPILTSMDMARFTAWRNSPPDADRYFSPLVALSDEVLKQFPKVYHEAYGMDLLRDGHLLFAERMKGLGVDTRVQIHSGYPHSLFSMMSAWHLEGSKVALNKLEEASRWMGVF
ncbi:hypothetical protein TWF718_010572 [Orbilia javanica]|uniref:Alpha/beta hydrolase fold-3 domain-containing protein n=1 Tax=Orbilia javanica TaxID=47235 RepID=A0AAN8MRA7_9PEZI